MDYLHFHVPVATAAFSRLGHTQDGRIPGCRGSHAAGGQGVRRNQVAEPLICSGDGTRIPHAGPDGGGRDVVPHRRDGSRLGLHRPLPGRVFHQRRPSMGRENVFLFFGVLDIHAVGDDHRSLAADLRRPVGIGNHPGLSTV